MQQLLIAKLNSNRLCVTTTYNSYTVLVDDVKGIGIYMEYEGGNTLIKTYKGTKVEKAICFIYNKDIF